MIEIVIPNPAKLELLPTFKDKKLTNEAIMRGQEKKEKSPLIQPYSHAQSMIQEKHCTVQHPDPLYFAH